LSRRIPPGIPGQTSFGTGFFQQSLAGPSPLRCDLRKQQSSKWRSNHQQPVPADDNRIRRDRLEMRQYGNFNFQGRDFLNAHARKTGIVQGSVDRGASNHFGQRAWIFHLSHAAAQFAAAI